MIFYVLVLLLVYWHHTVIVIKHAVLSLTYIAKNYVKMARLLLYLDIGTTLLL